MTDDLEQAAEYVEGLETPDFDEINFILNNNRDATASIKIKVLQSIEDGNLAGVKNILIDSLGSDYSDIKEDALHDMSSDESRDVINQIEQLADQYPVFQKIIDSSQND